MLVTGATGAGKTTTLAAVVGHINKTRRQHIVTIEDPIEILHSDEGCIVNQREVGLDTESFHQALRRALRQDPDVILIGELRDSETAETALQAAESGHLVLSTMHTVDAAETISRLVEFFPAIKQPAVRSILAGVLKGVVSQRLLPRIGGGRVAAVEVMVANSRIQELIRENKAEFIPEAIGEGSFFDMQTMTAALIRLVVDGEVEEEIAAAAAPNRHDFTIALGRAQKEARRRARPGGESGRHKPAEPEIPVGRPRLGRAPPHLRPPWTWLSRPSLSFPGSQSGSFLNVVAARVPLRRSIVHPGSACMSCSSAARLVRQRPAALVRAAARPLPSLRGVRSRVRYPAVEALTALLIAGCVLKFGLSWDALIASLLLRCARGRLGDRRRAADHPEPDRPARGRARARLRTRSCTRRSSGSPPGFGASAFLLLAALAYPAGMGMGDVKLALLLGVGLGRTVPVAMMIGMLSALVPSIVLLVRHGSAARKMAIPFGPFLALGGVVALFAGHEPPPRVPGPAVMETSVNLDNQPDLRLVDGEGEPEDSSRADDGRRAQRASSPM